MHVGKTKSFDKIVCLPEIGIRFARETGDHVGCDAGKWQEFPDLLDS